MTRNSNYNSNTCIDAYKFVIMIEVLTVLPLFSPYKNRTCVTHR